MICYTFEKKIIMVRRRHSSEVNISGLKMGGANPIRIQSMTTTDTNDADRTVEQAIRIINAGGEMVRVTTQGIREVQSLRKIKAQLVNRGYAQPIVADIHFNTKAAEIAALYVDKVRINPGNFVDKRAVFDKLIYTDEEYKEELNELYSKFSSFLNICKDNNTAVRIGTNQGSLSDRIMSRYGDSPEGMVEATMEFLRVCKVEKFRDVVISLKSSNPVVMVTAVRLLVKAMSNENMQYPLHLGVTEAGEGEDARVKSAVGIGALLTEGIGDTVRVSLTEDPENEIPVAKKIVEYASSKSEFLPYLYNTTKACMVNDYKSPVVVLDISNKVISDFDIPKLVGYKKIDGEDWKESEQTAEFVYINSLDNNLSELPCNLKVIMPFYLWRTCIHHRNVSPLFTLEEYNAFDTLNSKVVFHFVEILFENDIYKLKDDNKAIAVVSVNERKLSDSIKLASLCSELNIPFIAKLEYMESTSEDLLLKASVDTGVICIDKMCSGIWLVNNDFSEEIDTKSLSFSILQSTNYRITKTEFISCPGCGRTLFDLQTTVKKIKRELSHLKQLKIGIMGCIVNGPGEMGDVDYGYVGAAKGKVTLYKGREVVKKNILEDEALDELIELIKNNGDWISQND